MKEIVDDWAKNPHEYDDLVEEFDVLMALNHHRHAVREEYIENIKRNEIAIRVKLSDLGNNMDLSRIGNPTEKDFKRRERYEREYGLLVFLFDVAG